LAGLSARSAIFLSAEEGFIHLRVNAEGGAEIEVGGAECNREQLIRMKMWSADCSASSDRQRKSQEEGVSHRTSFVEVLV
jgi:hypothetical protein